MRPRALVPSALAAASLGPLAEAAGSLSGGIAAVGVAAAVATQTLPGLAPRLLPRHLAARLAGLPGAVDAGSRTRAALFLVLLPVTAVGLATAVRGGMPAALLLLAPLAWAGLRGLRSPRPGRDLRTLCDAAVVALGSLVVGGGPWAMGAAVGVAALAAAALPGILAARAARAAGAPAPARGRGGAAWRSAAAVAGGALLLFFLLPRPWPDAAPEAPPPGSRRPRPPADGLPGSRGVPSDFTRRSITMGEIGRLQQDPRPVLQAQVLRGGRPAHAAEFGALFRSGALEEFDGVTWEAADRRGTLHLDAGDGARDGWIHLPGRRLPRGEAVEQRLVFAAGGSDALFCLGLPVAVGGDGARDGVVALGRGEVRARDAYLEGAAFSIRSVASPGAHAIVDPESLSPERHAALLEIPEGHDETAALARGILGESARDRRLLRRLETWIERRCAYSLDLAARGSRPPVEAFLFDSRRGHCELFASAATVMLRAAGVPARLAIGFRGSDFDDETGTYTLRGSDAHAWVEAWLPGEGWVTLDPTPAARPADRPDPAEEGETAAAGSGSWVDGALSFDGEAQRRLLRGGVRLAAGTLRDTFLDGADRPRVAVIAVLLGAAALLAWAVARRGAAAPAAPQRAPRPSPAPPPESWAAFLVFLAARGIRRGPAETPRELADRAAAAGIEPVGAPRLLAEAYALERWGGRPPDPDARRRLLDLARRLAPSGCG